MMEIATITWKMLQIFGNTAGFDRLVSISFICTVVKLTRVTCTYYPQIHIFVMCSKDVALVAEWGELRPSVVPEIQGSTHTECCVI